jgi:solute carrier family 41
MVKKIIFINKMIEFIFILGVGGNLVAVQASRLSTALHQQGKPGEFRNDEQYYASTNCPNPYKVFCSKSMNR